MLVLSRRKDEGITIGRGLAHVMVIEIRGDKVRLGVDAARSVPVHRDEVEEVVELATVTPWVQTWSGWRVELGLGEHVPGTITIEDVAHALANLCRFGGHTRQFYSVAQHSVLVSQIVPQSHALAGLLHDAAEAYLGDVVSPVKALLGGAWEAVTDHIESRVARVFGVPHPMPRPVEEADRRMLRAEVEQLLGGAIGDWTQRLKVEAAKVVIRPMSPRMAEQWFLDRYETLVEARRVAAERDLAGADVERVGGC